MNDVEKELRDLGERAAREVSYHGVPARKIVRRARLRRGLVVGSTTLAVLAAAVAFPAIDWGRRGRSTPTAVGFLESAAAATEDAGTARIEFEMTMEFGGRASTISTVGVADFETGAARLRMEDSGPAGDGVLEAISLGTTLYQRILEPSEYATEKWHRTEVDVPAGAVGAFGGPGISPADMLSSLRTISTEVVDVGREELDGVAVTRYQATLDPSLFGAGMAPYGVEIDIDPMDVWVDGADRVRKLTWGMSSQGEEPGTDTDTQMTMRLWDFGLPVEITAPPQRDVTDAPLPEVPFGPAISQEISSSSGSSVTLEAPGPELIEPGVEEYTVTGEEGRSGPHAVVITTDHVTACLQGVPRGISRAMLIEAGSGLVIASVPGDTTSNPYGGGCTGPHLSTKVAQRLRDDPRSFELHFARDEGPDVVVPLTRVVPGR